MIDEKQIQLMRERVEVWSLGDKRINELVFAEIDRELERLATQAYGDKAYEAFAYLTKLRERLNTKEDEFRLQLQLMLDKNSTEKQSQSRK
jgi:hypothetical protein